LAGVIEKTDAMLKRAETSEDLAQYSDKAILAEVVRRGLKTETTIRVEYGDRAVRDEPAPAFRIERPPESPEVVVELPEAEPPLVEVEIVSRPGPLPPHLSGLLSVPNSEPFLGQGSRKRCYENQAKEARML
jgi:hypothetical protein